MTPWEEEFDHITGRVLFGRNELALSWVIGEPMPEDLPDHIINALRGSNTNDAVLAKMERTFSQGTSLITEEKKQPDDEATEAKPNHVVDVAEVVEPTPAEAAAPGPAPAPAEAAADSKPAPASPPTDSKPVPLHSGSKLAPLNGGAAKLAPLKPAPL